MSKRGFFGIGVFHSKTEHNIGTLWRSANQLGASFIFTIGKRYKEQASDTRRAPRHIPLYHYKDIKDFLEHRPYDCPLIGIEMSPRAHKLKNFVHPERAVYILGSEDGGLSNEIMDKCQYIIELEGHSFNVAVAGSIVMYDRLNKSL